MKMRPLVPAIGASAWVEGSKSHPLPSGLVDRTPVTVTAVDGHKVTVRDASGREWKLLERQVDCGADYCGPAGNWMHESKRQVLDALERQLERHRLSPRLDGLAGTVHDECESRLRWVLERNGRSVAADSYRPLERSPHSSAGRLEGKRQRKIAASISIAPLPLPGLFDLG